MRIATKTLQIDPSQLSGPTNMVRAIDVTIRDGEILYDEEMFFKIVNITDPVKRREIIANFNQAGKNFQ